MTLVEMSSLQHSSSIHVDMLLARCQLDSEPIQLPENQMEICLESGKSDSKNSLSSTFLGEISKRLTQDLFQDR